MPRRRSHPGIKQGNLATGGLLVPHTVYNLGSLVASARVQPRQFVAGIRPAQQIFIGRAREPKTVLVIQNAWLELNDFDVAEENFHQGKYSLALSNPISGEDAMDTALLLPVGAIRSSAVGATNPNSIEVEQLFKANGSLWAAQYVGIDFQESGTLVVCDADVHLDWTVAQVDWWSWFYMWNRLEAPPDGSLADGERAYA